MVTSVWKFRFTVPVALFAVCTRHNKACDRRQVTSDVSVISLAQALACQHTNTDTAVNTKIFKCYSA